MLKRKEKRKEKTKKLKNRNKLKVIRNKLRRENIWLKLGVPFFINLTGSSFLVYDKYELIK
jgi:hypothetical protein